jgi:hypothetical protein
MSPAARRLATVVREVVAATATSPAPAALRASTVG